jgi:hypothetical protein
MIKAPREKPVSQSAPPLATQVRGSLTHCTYKVSATQAAPIAAHAKTSGHLPARCTASEISAPNATGIAMNNNVAVDQKTSGEILSPPANMP